MKTTLAAALVALIAAPAIAQTHYVQPHVTKNGTYVQGHQQTNPDNSRVNNWSSSPNVNPYTGQQGTVNPYAAPMPNPYAQPQQPRQPNPYAPKF